MSRLGVRRLGGKQHPCWSRFRPRSRDCRLDDPPPAERGERRLRGTHAGFAAGYVAEDVVPKAGRSSTCSVAMPTGSGPADSDTLACALRRVGSAHHPGPSGGRGRWAEPTLRTDQHGVRRCPRRILEGRPEPPLPDQGPRMRRLALAAALDRPHACGRRRPRAGRRDSPGARSPRGSASTTAMAVAPDGLRLRLRADRGHPRRQGRHAPGTARSSRVERRFGMVGTRADRGTRSTRISSRNGFVYVCYVAKAPIPTTRSGRFTARGDVAVGGERGRFLEGDDQNPIGWPVPVRTPGRGAPFRQGRHAVSSALGEQFRRLANAADGHAPGQNPAAGSTPTARSRPTIPSSRPPRGNTAQSRRSAQQQSVHLRRPEPNPGGSPSATSEASARRSTSAPSRPGTTSGWPTVEHGDRPPTPGFAGRSITIRPAP